MKRPLSHPTPEAVKAIHAEVLSAHGGRAGLRDAALLESAVAAPQATMMGKPMFAEPLEIAAASETMRRILVDRARRGRAAKNGGKLRRTCLELDDLSAPPESAVDLLDLDEHLARFAQLHPDKARILELRFFAGLTMTQIAALTGQSEKTVRRYWVYARTWLYDAIESQRERARDSVDPL